MLKEIRMWFMKNCTEDDLIKSVASSKYLKTLRLYKVRVSDNFLEYVSENLLKLTTLSLYDCEGISFDGIKLICKLDKLEELDLSSCDSVSDDALELIPGLSKLKVLRIEYLRSRVKNITGAGLVGLTNLKELHIHKCYGLQDSNVINFLICAPNLELLDISGCFKLTNSVVDAAIQVTIARTNNLMLKVCVGATRINTYKIREKSPLLHLCTDFYDEDINGLMFYEENPQLMDNW